MAGTTVRDDGAVEAAFDAALRGRGDHAAGRPATTEAPESSCATTMGWSKADVFAACSSRARRRGRPPRSRGLRGDRRRRRRAAEIPGALAVLRELRARGVLVCLTTGFAPSTRDACSTRWAGEGEIDLALSPGRRRAGPAGPDMILGAMARLGVAEPRAASSWSGDTVSDLEAGTAGRGGGGGRRPERRPRRGDLVAAPHTAIIPDVTGSRSPSLALSAPLTARL